VCLKLLPNKERKNDLKEEKTREKKEVREYERRKEWKNK
jgi:hypothetical protein